MQGNWDAPYSLKFRSENPHVAIRKIPSQMSIRRISVGRTFFERLRIVAPRRTTKTTYRRAKALWLQRAVACGGDGRRGAAGSTYEVPKFRLRARLRAYRTKTEEKACSAGRGSRINPDRTSAAKARSVATG